MALVRAAHKDPMVRGFPDLGILRAYARRCRRLVGRVARAVPVVPVPEHMELPNWFPSVRPRAGTKGPQRLQKRFDPEQLLLAMQFGTRLRNLEEFTEAVVDADNYLSYLRGVPIDDEDAVRAFDHPSGRTLYRNQLRVDAVAMLLERREWAELIARDGLASLHCFMDGSPVSGGGGSRQCCTTLSTQMASSRGR
jgi:hypothetical protein